MLRVSQIKLKPDHTREELRAAVAGKLRIGEETEFAFRVIRQSIDARKKPDIFYVYTVDVKGLSQKEESRILRGAGRGRKAGEIERAEETAYRLPRDTAGPARCRPVIVGSGPAGLFCALVLARAGRLPLVIERGEPVEQRASTVRRFWEKGSLDPDSNVQFGEGGAGTFSDGKLNTGIKDPAGRIRFVLQTFVEAGADPDILYSYRPHIGTDRLREVIAHIRREIISLGGTFLFSHRLEDIRPAGASAGEAYELRVRSLRGDADSAAAPGEVVRITADTVVLALGHSARDTLEMLRERAMDMRPKAFAVGVRIQHPQRVIDAAMYGPDCPYRMPPSPYKLTCRLEAGGVYSFCMCPGGYVVNASSEEGRIAVNGMSLHDRGSGSANAAIVMTVSVEQYARYLRSMEEQEEQEEKEAKEAREEETEPDPLLGVRFARMLERRAWKAGKGCIPAQTFAGFCGGTAASFSGSIPEPLSEALSEALPEAPVETLPDSLTGESGGWVRIEGKYVPADVRGIFPKEIGDSLEEAIRRFDRVIPGFADGGALLCAPESRTSSPVRLERDDGTLESLSHPGIYPCGEGAGYAGGITSAAVDGIRVAEAILRGRKS